MKQGVVRTEEILVARLAHRHPHGRVIYRPVIFVSHLSHLLNAHGTSDDAFSHSHTM